MSALLLPWDSWAEPWQLEVVGIDLDGRVRPEAVDLEHRRLRLHDLAWEAADIGVRVHRRGDGPQPDPFGLAVHILVTCSDTALREPVLLEPDADSWLGTVPLRLADVAGSVRLTAQATADLRGFRRLVAGSDAWQVSIDPGSAPLPAGTPPFRTVWIDFAGDGAPAAVKAVHDTHALVDTSGGEPVLYLNQGIDGLQDLLHADHARGARRMARDLVGAEIARQVLATAFRSAADSVLELSGETAPTVPQGRFERQVLEAVARAMSSSTGAQDLVERIVAGYEGPARDREALWSEVDAAIAKVAGTTTALSEAAREVRFA